MVVELTDGGFPLAGVTLNVTGPSGSGLPSTPVVTNSAGQASLVLRMPRTLGPASFQVSAPGATPLNFGATVSSPANGTLITLVNVDNSRGNDGTPGPATLAHVGELRAMVQATDGSVYFTDAYFCWIYKLSNDGTLTQIAGNGTCGETGDGASALSAELYYPSGLALDEVDQLLFVADNLGNTVRVVNLITGQIDLVAGGGTAPAPGYGDGSAALSAVLSQPFNLAFHVESGTRYLYVADYGHQRLRRINLDAQTIEAFVGQGSGNAQASFYNCGNYLGCEVTWDPAGNAYISATLTTPGGYANGIIRRRTNGTYDLITGSSTTNYTDGVPAIQASYASPPGMAFDEAGDLFVVDRTRFLVREIDASTSRIRTVIGNGTQGYQGNDSSAINAELNGPWSVVVEPNQNLLITDFDNYMIREAWGLAQSTPSGASLSLVSGDGQSTQLDQTPTQVFKVQLLDGNGQPLSGYTVNWSVVDPGGALYQNATVTNANGYVQTVGRVGLAPGPYHFQASFNDIFGNPVNGSPVTFTVTAVAPTTGTVFTTVNMNHVTGDTGFPGPATLANVGELRDFARASDGTLYITDYTYGRVLKLSPAGYLTSFVGTGSGGYAGDNGPASAAQLSNPQGIALDEANGLLYIADSGNNVIRLVDLTTTPPTISTFAGVHGGTGSAPYGDNGPASAAILSNPTHLVLRTEGGVPYLYVSDLYHNSIRRINLLTTLITTWFTTTTVSGGGGKVTFDDCGTSDGCSVVWDSNNVPYISGHFFDGVFYNPQAIVRWTQTGPGGGTLTMLVGTNPGNSGDHVSDGVAGTNTALSASPQLSFGANGNLTFVDQFSNRVRYLDSSSGNVYTIAGDPTGNTTGGYSGDSVPLSQSVLNHPWMYMLTPDGHQLISDDQNYCLREAY